MKLSRLVIIPLLFLNAELFSGAFSDLLVRESVARLDKSIQKNGWTLNKLRSHIMHMRQTGEYRPLSYNPHFCLDIHTRWNGSAQLIDALQTHLTRYNSSLKEEDTQKIKSATDLLVFIFKHEYSHKPVLDHVGEQARMEPMEPYVTTSSIVKLMCAAIAGYYSYKIGLPLFSYFFSNKKPKTPNARPQPQTVTQTRTAPLSATTPAPQASALISNVNLPTNTSITVHNLATPESCVIAAPVIGNRYPQKIRISMNDKDIAHYVGQPDGMSINRVSETAIPSLEGNKPFTIMVEVEVDTRAWEVPWLLSSLFAANAPKLVKTTRIIHCMPQAQNITLAYEPFTPDESFLPAIGQVRTWCSDKDTNMPPSGFHINGATITQDICTIDHVE